MRLFKNQPKKDTQIPQTGPQPLKTDFRKLKLLVTVVNRHKADSYMDYLTSQGVNFQTAVAGKGTASSDTLYLLGLDESDKSVLFSLLREDLAEGILQGLNEKFHTLKNGKGIAFTIPLTSVIGVSVYRFLSDQRSQ